MSIAGFVIGILAFLGFLVGLIPFLGWTNWVNIPFAILGFILSLVGVTRGPNKGLGIAGLTLCAIAIVVGALRLGAGGGII
ncbi:MAG: hypothetical protein TUN42_08970 [Dehalogenimonas sp.]